MANARTQPKKTYNDISEILDVIFDGDGDSEIDIDLGQSDFSDSSDPDWEYVTEHSKKSVVNDEESVDDRIINKLSNPDINGS